MRNAPEAEDHGYSAATRTRFFFTGLLCQITDVLLVIGGASDAMVAETSLPYWTLVKELFAKRVRGAAFDELNRMLQSDGFGRGEQRVKMIGHQDETVEAITPLVSVAEQGFDKNLARWSNLEYGAAFPGTTGHEICSGNACVALRNGHPSAAKAALLCVVYGTAEAVP
jgi:hypothetical protein